MKFWSEWSKKRRFFIVLLAMAWASIYTGCKDNPPDPSIFADLSATLNQRVAENQAIADELYSSGLLPAEATVRIKDSIEKRANELADNLSNGDTIDVTTCMQFSKAIVYTSLGGQYNNGSSTTSEQICVDGAGWHLHNSGSNCAFGGLHTNKFLTNYVYSVWNNSKSQVQKYFAVPISKESTATKVEPIKLVDDDILAGEGGLIQRLSYPVYVLSPNNNYDLAKIHAAVAQVESSDDVNVYLSGYFQKVMNSAGKEVTLIDLSNPDNQIIRATRGNMYINDETQEIDVDHKLAMGNFFPTSKDGRKTWEGDTHVVYTNLTIQSNTSWKSMCLPNCEEEQPGNDMGFYQNGMLVAKVRLYEFNRKAYERIRKTLTLSDDTWFITSTGTGGAAYLMQYPVGYVSGFSVGDESGGSRSYKADIELSDLRLNIKTGLITKQRGIRCYVLGSTSVGGTIESPIDPTPQKTSEVEPLYKLSDGTPGSSSFGIYGTTGVDKSITSKDDLGGDVWNCVFGDSTNENGVVSVPEPANLPRIILLDYMEASYSPKVNSEGIVCYGRRIRLDPTKLSGTLGNSRVKLGYYLDSNNKSLDEASKEQSTRWIYLEDVCDINLLARQFNNSTYANESLVATIPGYGTEAFTQSDGEIPDEMKKLEVRNMEYKEKIEMLPHVTVKEIKTTTKFPGSMIGYIDASSVYNTEMPLMYALAVKKPFGETGLISWITATSETDSTNWWNKWLSDRGYMYSIGASAISEYLKDNYSYELAESGIIVLDLETIAKIQEDMTRQEKIDRMQMIRTGFKVLGFCLILYGTILMLCWALDVNVDIGLNSLNKVTLGHLIAVSSTVEIPKESESGSKYVGFQEILLQAIKIYIIGTLLLLIDIVSIIIKMVDLLGGLGEVIGNLFGR